MYSIPPLIGRPRMPNNPILAREVSFGQSVLKRGTTVHAIHMYSGPCILRPHVQPEEYGLKLKVVLKWRDIYIENITVVLLDGQS